MRIVDLYMDYFKRIVAVTEKYFLEICIHSVTIALPLASSLQIIIKRNKSKQEKSLIAVHDPKLSIAYIDSTIHFPVTLYKTGAGYTSKVYYFRLVQHCNNKSIKNGKAKLDISTIVKNPLHLHDLRLNGSSDSKASICISASLQRAVNTLSYDDQITQTNEEEDFLKRQRISNSFDETVVKKHEVDEKKHMREQQKFLRRLEIVNSLNNSPQSAIILEESEASSCASPMSPMKSPESPGSPDRVQESAQGFSMFSIRPILVEFTEESINENTEGKKNLKNTDEDSEEQGDYDSYGEREREFNKSPENAEENVIVEEVREESESSSTYSEGINVENQEGMNGRPEGPLSSMAQTSPNVHSKEALISNAEISPEDPSLHKKCCTCILF